VLLGPPRRAAGGAGGGPQMWGGARRAAFLRWCTPEPAVFASPGGPVNVPTSIIAGVCTSGGTGVGPTQVTMTRLTVMGGSAGAAKHGALRPIMANIDSKNPSMV